ATPDTLSLGGTFSSTAGANLKLKVYDDGTNIYGLGVSNQSLDYGSFNKHSFYAQGVVKMTLEGSNLGIGDASPAALLTVGSGDLFQVASNGNLTSFNAGNWTFSNDTNIVLSGGVNGLSFDTDVLSIDATNNRVGIGTAAPTSGYRLDVQDANAGVQIKATASDEYARLNLTDGSTNFIVGKENNAGGGLLTGSIGNAGIINVAGAFDLQLGTSDTVRMTVLSTGNVGIGDTSPAALFTVGSGDLFQIASNGNLTSSNAGTWTFSNDTNIALTGGVNGLSFDTDVLSIDATNNKVGIGTTGPSYQLSVVGGAGSGRMGLRNTSNANNEYTSLFYGNDVGDNRFQIFLGGSGYTYNTLWSDNLVYYTSLSKSHVFVTSDTSRMIIQGDGKVGIGNTAPDTTLEVTGGLCVSDAAGDDCTTAAGDIRADGAITANAFDIAERYASQESLTPGTIVVVDQTKSMYVAKASSSSIPALGIVSSDPGFVLGWEDNKVFKNAPYVAQVALAGRVPVKITNENGNIIPGDFLTSSVQFPGYAMRATTSGNIIGQALEGFTSAATNDSSMITVFVKVAWQNINNTIALDAPKNVDGTNPATVQGTNQTGSLAAADTSSTFIINQKTSTDKVVADILQVQSGEANRLMVSNTGALTLNAELECSSCAILAVKNSGSEKFSINARGDISIYGQIIVYDDTMAGSIVTNTADGLAEITFTNNLGTGKPVVQLTAEGDTAVFAQVKEWRTDGAGRYIGVVFRAFASDGVGVQSIVHYNVTGKPEGYVTYGLDNLEVTDPPTSFLESNNPVVSEETTGSIVEEQPLTPTATPGATTEEAPEAVSVAEPSNTQL
ncbi:MAG: hypothetical protein M3Q64_00215, partial [bacterium]|nr:hypothetical protein [bacterium]